MAFNWNYTGNHGINSAQCVFIVYVAGAAIDYVITLQPVQSDGTTSISGGFNFSGSLSFPVTAGQTWELQIGGYSGDPTTTLQGTLTLSNYAGPGSSGSGTPPANSTQPGWGDNTAADVWSWPLFGYVESAAPGGASYGPNCSANGVAFQAAPSLNASPASNACNYMVLQGPHPGAMQVALGDGSVRSVSSALSLSTWQNACQPASGVPPGSDW